MGRAKDAPAAKSAPDIESKVETLPDPAPAEAAAEAAPELVSDPAPANPFGKPTVIHHKKEDGGVGIPVSAFQGKPMEPEYVEPEERSNPEYLAKLAAEKEAADREQAQRDKAKRAFGFGTRGQVVGASPNSPQAKQNTFS